MRILSGLIDFVVKAIFFFFVCGLLVTLKTYDTGGNAEKMSKEVFEMRTRQDLQLSVNWKCSEVERIA